MGEERYTVDELSAATGHSVRNIRYYTGLGLLPGPAREGRIAVYGAEHRARLELVTALQDHGFTLEAIGRYLDRRGAEATAEDLAMQRAMIESWANRSPADVQVRIARELLSLGLPRDTLAAVNEATTRHMTALAEELDGILRTEIVDPFLRTHHSAEEAERLEKGLPRLRELTVEALTVAFQAAVNRLISRSLDRVR